MSERLDELNQYIANLSPDERADHDAKLKSNSIFDLIKQGDTVGVAIAIQNEADITQQDDQGMTPLHVSAEHGTELIADVLMIDANGAVWQRDNQDRLPLDVARENGHQELGDKLEQITYPEQFLQLDGVEEQEFTNQYSTKIKASDAIDTSPPYLSQMKKRALLMQIQNKKNEIDGHKR